MAEHRRRPSDSGAADPPTYGSLFAGTVGMELKRTFEFATIRLRNMDEVLGHWRNYLPRDDCPTQKH